MGKLPGQLFWFLLVSQHFLLYWHHPIKKIGWAWLQSMKTIFDSLPLWHLPFLIYRLLIIFSANSVKHGFLPSSSFQLFVPLLLWLAHTVRLNDNFFQSYWYFLFFNNFLSDLVTDSPIQFGSVTPSCPTLCDPMNRSTPGLPVHHQLPKFTQTHVHRVSDAIQPSRPRLSPSPSALNLSQHQGLFQWVGCTCNLLFCM